MKGLKGAYALYACIYVLRVTYRHFRQTGLSNRNSIVKLMVNIIDLKWVRAEKIKSLKYLP